MPAGMMVARTCASCPAPLGMRTDLPPAKARLAASMACWNLASMRAGAPGRAGVILLAGEGDPVLPDADDGGDDADAETVAFERPALLDMRLEIPDMAPAFGRGARAAGKTHLVQRFPHGSVAVAIARGVDVIIGDSANVGPAAKERAEMSFFIAP